MFVRSPGDTRQAVQGLHRSNIWQPGARRPLNTLELSRDAAECDSTLTLFVSVRLDRAALPLFRHLLRLRGAAFTAEDVGLGVGQATDARTQFALASSSDVHWIRNPRNVKGYRTTTGLISAGVRSVSELILIQDLDAKFRLPS